MPKALSFVRALRGDTFLLNCDDGNYYAVKTAKHPRGVKDLASCWITARIAAALGLPCPLAKSIEVEADLTDAALDADPCCTITQGTCYGSLHMGNKGNRTVFDTLPSELAPRLWNPESVVAAQLLSLWLGDLASPHFIFLLGKYDEHLSLTATHGFSAVMLPGRSSLNGGRWDCRFQTPISVPCLSAKGCGGIGCPVCAARTCANRWRAVVRNLAGRIHETAPTCVSSACDSLPEPWRVSLAGATELLHSHLLERAERLALSFSQKQWPAAGFTARVPPGKAPNAKPASTLMANAA